MEQQNFLSCIEFLFLFIGSWLDIRDREIPAIYLLLFGVLAVTCNLLWKYQTLREFLFGCSVGGMFLFASCISKEAIGYGDGLGILVLGMFEGWRNMISMVFEAFLIGGIYGLWKIVVLKEQKGNEIPFYPFLLAGFLVVNIC